MPYLYQSYSIHNSPSVTLTIPDEVNSSIIKIITKIINIINFQCIHCEVKL